MRAPWTPRPNNPNEKVREISYTLSLTGAVGPKHSQVIESQVMHSESHPGRQYIIDVEVQNNGIPYADSFYVTVHFYLSRVSDTESSLNVIGAVKYRKTVWGIVKSKLLFMFFVIMLMYCPSFHREKYMGWPRGLLLKLVKSFVCRNLSSFT